MEWFAQRASKCIPRSVLQTYLAVRICPLSSGVHPPYPNIPISYIEHFQNREQNTIEAKAFVERLKKERLFVQRSVCAFISA